MSLLGKKKKNIGLWHFVVISARYVLFWYFLSVGYIWCFSALFVFISATSASEKPRHAGLLQGRCFQPGLFLRVISMSECEPFHQLSNKTKLRLCQVQLTFEACIAIYPKNPESQHSWRRLVLDVGDSYFLCMLFLENPRKTRTKANQLPHVCRFFCARPPAKSAILVTLQAPWSGMTSSVQKGKQKNGLKPVKANKLTSNFVTSIRFHKLRSFFVRKRQESAIRSRTMYIFE